MQAKIQELVDGGFLPLDLEDVLGRLLDKRNEAAYRFARGNWTEQEAVEILATAESFVREVESILDRTPGELKRISGQPRPHRF